MSKSYFVQHTHWDREWYFTNSDALVLSDQVFTESLDELEKNKKVNFCLDGQSSIVDDYIEIHPEKLEVIRKLVAERRLFVGPWYTQTDALLVDAESILRNLIIGINDTIDKYGEPMMLGYLPDTFGFNAQLPTILNQVGIDNFLCWRGLNFEKLVKSPYFKWEGLGEKSVYAMNFPFGYMTGLLSLEAEADLEEFVNDRLDPAIKFNAEHGNNEDILVPSGIDQKNIVKDFDQVIKKINEISDYENVISSYPEFVDIIRNKKNLPTYQGELREPVHSRAHRSIGSVRTRVKIENYKLEQKLIRIVEPMMIIAKSNGVTIGNGLVKKLWKIILENQAHDSIGGCVSDNVAEDILHRFKQANELADGIENLISKRIADALDLESNEIIVFNTDPKPFNGEKILHVVAPNKNIMFNNVSDVVLINEKYYPARENIKREVPKGAIFIEEPSYYELDVRVNIELPALGYKIINFEDTDKTLDERSALDKEGTTSLTISNDIYEINFEEGKISLKNVGKTINNFIEVVDSANDGDTYDYSPLPGDTEKTFTFERAQKIEDPLKTTIKIIGTMNLPYDLEDRLSNSPKLEKVEISIELNLEKYSDLITGKINVDNQVLSHRLRLKINGLNEDESSIAQIQNGFSKNEPDFIPEDWEEKYVEKPVNLEIFDKSVSVQNDYGYVTIFAEGLKEYERIDSHLFVTLMATTGELGKPDLAWRPGRASGDTTNEGHIMMPTPLAQEIGTNEFSFAIRMDSGDFKESKTAHISQDWVTPSVTYQSQVLNVFINRLDNKIWPLKNPEKPERYSSRLNVPEDLLVSAAYPAYRDEDSFIIRLANPTASKISIDSSLLNQAEIVNALEEPMEKTNSILPYDYITLKFPYNKK